MIVNFSLYQELLRESWWLATYYSSELGVSVGIVFRIVAGVFALYSVIIFLKKGESFLTQISGKIGAALLFEGLYLLTYAPSVILGFVYPLAEKQHLWYFEPTPPWLIVFLVAGVACLAMIVTIVPSLFKLRSKIVRHASKSEIIKWSSITGIAYLMFAFWLNYTLTWAATLVYWPERDQPGIEILYNPVAITGFLGTVIGLLFISLSCLKVTLPAVKGRPENVNIRNLGYVILAFGCYFLLMQILYIVAGGYSAQPTAWMEIIGPHNPDLWCVSFIFPGICLIVKSEG